jgi:hypothetical protein
MAAASGLRRGGGVLSIVKCDMTDVSFRFSGKKPASDQAKQSCGKNQILLAEGDRIRQKGSVEFAFAA